MYRFLWGVLGQRPSLLPFNKKKIYILIKVVQMLHCFVFNDLDPICSGTRVVQVIHCFVFNDLAFAQGVTLLGYWYRGI